MTMTRFKKKMTRPVDCVYFPWLEPCPRPFTTSREDPYAISVNLQYTVTVHSSTGQDSDRRGATSQAYNEPC